MKKLQKEFEAFDKKICIDSETEMLIEKRKKLKKDMESYFPDECANYGITVNKTDLRFILQGSYKIGTTIKTKSVDMDYAVIMPLDTDKHDDPRKVKKAARSALEIKKIRIPSIKEPCVTVAYHLAGEEVMHIDFPIYAEHNGCKYLARGKETSTEYKWELADPEGLNDYFLKQFKDRPQLKRVIRYMKQWKEEKYGSSINSHEVPPSIGLTILACEKYIAYTENGDDDLNALYYTLKGILDKFVVYTDLNGEITSASIICSLPVIPNTDVFYKMRANPKHMITFYNRLSMAVNNLQQAINLEEAHEAAKYVQKVLGSEFDVPEKKATVVSSVNKGEYSFG